MYRQSGSRSLMPEVSPKRAYTHIGLYKGNIVAIKPIHKRSLDITRSIRKELKQVKKTVSVGSKNYEAGKERQVTQQQERFKINMGTKLTKVNGFGVKLLL